MTTSKLALFGLTWALSSCAVNLCDKDPSDPRCEQNPILPDTLQVMPTRIADSVVTQFRGYHKDLPEELFTRFRAQLDLEEMMNRIQAVYDKNFTDEELDGLIAFYSTPVGQSVLHKQTAIAEQTSATSGEWGEKIGQQLIAEITRARTEKKAAPPASPPPAP